MCSTASDGCLLGLPGSEQEAVGSISSGGMAVWLSTFSTVMLLSLSYALSHLMSKHVWVLQVASQATFCWIPPQHPSGLRTIPFVGYIPLNTCMALNALHSLQILIYSHVAGRNQDSASKHRSKWPAECMISNVQKRLAGNREARDGNLEQAIALFTEVVCSHFHAQQYLSKVHFVYGVLEHRNRASFFMIETLKNTCSYADSWCSFAFKVGCLTRKS